MHLFRQLAQASDAAGPAVDADEAAGRESDRQRSETALAEKPEPGS
jgi:hypothetical protein